MNLPAKCFLFLTLSGLLGTAAQAHGNDWTPQPDTPWLQEIGHVVPTEEPLSAVAVHQGAVYVGTPSGLRVYHGNGEWAGADPPLGVPILRLMKLGGALWANTASGLYRLGQEGAWAKLLDEPAAGVAAVGHTQYAATTRALHGAEAGKLVPISGGTELPGEIVALAAHAESLYAMTTGGLAVFNGREWETSRVVEWGEEPPGPVRAMLSAGPRLLLAAGDGLHVLRGTGMTRRTGSDGLPVTDITGLAHGFDGDVWLATPRGAVRMVDGEYHYFAGPRWLPSDEVHAIACSDTAVYIATSAGLGVVTYEPYTLLKKAAYYERHLEEWGQKRMAFTHKLEWNHEAGAWMREVSDNDVGWSTHYWAAQAFKYAATGDPAARQAAADGFNALKWSEEITPIEGFPARSIWAVGETGHQAQGGSGGYPAEWNPTPDGKWAWKGDTSSDEIDAHFYYASIFHDLAANEAEKAQVREHLGRVAGHIMDEGWVLRDLDGKPTVWGRWDPEYFAGRGRGARGLNGLEALNYMRTAHAITGDSRFASGLAQLRAWGYPDHVIFQKHTLGPAIFHSDDRLAFYSYYTLLQYETDPYLRGIYRRSLERSWEIERVEQIPWFNFIYGALTGNACEAAQAAAHLRETPLDLRRHSYDVTHREDLHTPQGYVAYCDALLCVSPRIRGLVRWTASSGKLEDGGGALSVVDPSGWLDAYWMGRYLGMILPPATDDPELTTVPRRGLQLGALPYDGPPMPRVLED